MAGIPAGKYRNSTVNFVKKVDNLKTVYFGLIWILNMKVKIEQKFSRFQLDPDNIPYETEF